MLELNTADIELDANPIRLPSYAGARSTFVHDVLSTCQINMLHLPRPISYVREQIRNASDGSSLDFSHEVATALSCISDRRCTIEHVTVPHLPCDQGEINIACLHGIAREMMFVGAECLRQFGALDQDIGQAIMSDIIHINRRLLALDGDMHEYMEGSDALSSASLQVIARDNIVDALVEVKEILVAYCRQ